MIWNSLKEFSNWYWEGSVPELRLRVQVPEHPIKVSPLGLCEFVVFRDGQFQVELITLFAGKEIPAHRHPDVQSVDVHLTGTGESFIGNWYAPQADLDKHPLNNRMAIPANVPHWGHAVTDVAVVSLQRWNNGITPTFITDNWESVG